MFTEKNPCIRVTTISDATHLCVFTICSFRFVVEMGGFEPPSRMYFTMSHSQLS